MVRISGAGDAVGPNGERRPTDAIRLAIDKIGLVAYFCTF